MPYSLATLFQDELDKRSYITQLPYSSADILDSTKLWNWFCLLLGISNSSKLGERIRTASKLRLIHSTSTYLLGCSIQSRLGLHFQKLPRIFSNKSVGNAFHFFWAMICLSHDLSYQYELNSGTQYPLDAMDDLSDRKAMFCLCKDYDLMSLTDLSSFYLSDAETEWCTQSLRVIRRYDRYRRGKHGVIDHGIAGGILLYSLLMEYADEGNTSKSAKEEERDPVQTAAQPFYTGELRANRSHSRFRACALFAALTVARHNIWHNNSDYPLYDLDELNGTKISCSDPLNHMLLFLDYMDTIDPIKKFYTGALQGTATMDKNELAERFDFLFQQMQFSFLDNRVMKISIPEHSVSSRLISEWNAYCKKMEELTDWLEVAKPEIQEKTICFPFPNFSLSPRSYPAGITEDEIIALCLYEGSVDTSKAGAFYQMPNAYQSINLLLTPGIEGEKVRIGIEHQRPRGLYIQEWERTLRNIERIFSAQCKCASSLSNAEKASVSNQLFRVDRRVNISILQDSKSTYAFTSSSRARFLPNIASTKKDVVLLNIILNQSVPFADYSGILQDDYLFIDEAEVLLPPFLSFEKIIPLYATESEHAMDSTKGKVEKYTINFNKMRFPPAEHTQSSLRQILDNLKEEASSTLEALCSDPLSAQNADISAYPEYIQWKNAFQELVGLRLSSIWEAYQW